MDWLKEIMMPVLVLIIGYFVKQITPWTVKLIQVAMDALKKLIANHTNATMQMLLNVVATEVVRYVEQKYTELKGTEKFEKAVELMETKVDNLTEKLGVGREVVSKQDIELLIESAVNALNGWGGTNP